MGIGHGKGLLQTFEKCRAGQVPAEQTLCFEQSESLGPPGSLDPSLPSFELEKFPARYNLKSTHEVP